MRGCLCPRSHCKPIVRANRRKTFLTAKYGSARPDAEMNNDPLEVLFRLRTTRYASSASRVVWCSGTRRLFLFFDIRITRPSSEISPHWSARASDMRRPVAAMRPNSVTYITAVIDPCVGIWPAACSSREISSAA
jgi:hypothetical protein